MLIRIPERWRIPERDATPEAAILERRRFIRAAGLAGTGLILGCALPGGDRDSAEATPAGPAADLYPAPANPKYRAEGAVTDQATAARYNNFYEFTETKEEVWRLVERFQTDPWRIEIGGLVEKPATLDLEELLRRMPLEERIYRFRCVEAWAMIVPWTGFPFRRLVETARPLASARFVRLVSFHRPEEAPGQARAAWYPWPYFEGLTLEEATHDLTMAVSGIYGHPLPKQHGAPVRLIVPWKYGFKSIKSVARIEFTADRPPTFWNQVAPAEYDFFSNVDPAVPHLRWSQATERRIGTGEVVPTLPYNGYAAEVAGLYRS